MMARSLYRGLLRLYPASFRREYGTEMERVFAERLRAESGSARVGLWLEVIPDIVVGAAVVQWDYVRQDVRFAIRTLSRATGFTITAVAVIALGIGATTSVFSITDRVFLRTLPFGDPHRLVRLWENVPRYSRMELSPANYRDWESRATAFEAMAPFYSQSFNLVGAERPEQVHAVAVGPELFSMLGVAPHLGRTLGASDADEASPQAVVLSHGLWQSVFGGDAQILGAPVRLDDTSYTVVGVMPEDFFFPERTTALWIAARFAPVDYEDRNDHYLQVLAKLAPGVSIERARSEMEVVTDQLARAHPETNEESRATIGRLRDQVTFRSRWLLGALAAASLCVLLIACTNLANLLVARAMTRARELTVRAALGGGRERIVRQLLTEAMMLALAGGGLGVFLASLVVPLMTRLVPVRLPLGEATALEPRVLVFAVMLTLLTGVVFGVLPALRGSRGLDVTELRAGSRIGAERRTRRLRGVLVVTQVAISIVLLVGAGLLVRALTAVRAIDPGFDTAGVVAFHTPLSSLRYAETARRAALFDRILSDVAALDGVTSAAYVSFLPMVMRGGIWPVTVSGENDDPQRRETASLRFVTPDFFRTMGIPLLRGRDVDASDTSEPPFNAVVSASFARRYWPDQDPLGRTFEFAFRERVVVGVSGDIRVRGLESPSEPQVYLPYRQVPDGALPFYAPKELVVRMDAGRELGPIADAVRAVVARADAEIPVAAVRTLEDVVRADTEARSTQIAVVGLFAALSLLLSGIGIYGLLAVGVTERRAELGLRIAFGARASDILAMVVREGAWLAVVGTTLGVVVGYGAGRAMEAVLAGIDPGDVTTYAAVTMLAVAMTLTGSVLPAIRAARVDPLQATRSD